MSRVILGSEYFIELFKTVNLPLYEQGPVREYGKLFYDKSKSDAAIESKIKASLESQRFCIVNFPKNYSLEWLTKWQESFLGELMVSKNPNKSSYARVAVKKDSPYFADSNKAQPLHSDEGYTTVLPNYISLFCSDNSIRGGISTLVSVEEIFSAFPKTIKMLLSWRFHLLP